MTGLLHRHSAAPIWSERLGSISLAMPRPFGIVHGLRAVPLHSRGLLPRQLVVNPPRLGAWSGAGWATRLKSQALHRMITVMLASIAVVLVIGHGAEGSGAALTGIAQIVAGVIAGFGIGFIASLLGVAGGELLIPTLVLLFGVDIKLAGSLSLAVSLPTMIVGFARYSRDSSFAVLNQHWPSVLVMAAGSVFGSFIGGQLLGIVRTAVLPPLLAAILVISAVKVWRH
jgi:uncharacterized membrane protein YfcA